MHGEPSNQGLFPSNILSQRQKDDTEPLLSTAFGGFESQMLMGRKISHRHHNLMDFITDLVSE